MQQFLKKLDIGFADLYVVGLILCVGAAEVAHLAGLFLGVSIGRISILWAGLAAALLIAWGILWFLGRRRERGISCHKALPLVFIVLVLVQMIYLFCMQQVITPGDITLETVVTFLREDGIHKVNPLTGSAYVNPSIRFYLLTPYMRCCVSLPDLCRRFWFTIWFLYLCWEAVILHTTSFREFCLRSIWESDIRL